MPKNRIRLARIVHESTRKSTLRKRLIGIFKKTGEIAVLCDVEAGTIVYTPGVNDPAVFPSIEVAKRLLEKFADTPLHEQKPKRETLESYLAKMVRKEAEQITRSKKKNDRREVQEAMNQIFEGNNLENFDVNQLNDLALLAAEKLRQLNWRQQNPEESSIVDPEVGEEEEEGDDDDDDYDDDEDEAIMFQAQMIDPMDVGLDEIFKDYDRTVDRTPSERELGPEDFFLDYDRPGLALGLVFRGVDRNVDDQDASGSVPKSVQQLMDDKWFMETMASTSQTEPPSESTVTTSQIGPRDIEKPPDSTATTTTTAVDAKEEEELPDDLNAVFPHIYSP